MLEYDEFTEVVRMLRVFHVIFIVLGLVLVSCNETIELADETIGTVDKNPKADFVFNGADHGLWVSDTKISVRFLPAQGGSGSFRYQLIDQGGNVLTGSNGNDLIKNSNGMYHLSYDGYPSGTDQRVLVRAIDLESKAPDTNEKYISLSLPSGFYPNFTGVKSCSPFPGAEGQTKINVFWNKGGIYYGPLAGLEAHSVASYKIYYCKKSHGTDCLETDSNKRSMIAVHDPAEETQTIAGLSPNTSYYFRVTAVSRGATGNPETKKEERNIEFVECETQVSSGPIIFAGIDQVDIEDAENGINEATGKWIAATGGFSGYRLYYHPVLSENSVFNYSDPKLQVLTLVDTNQIAQKMVGLDSFTYHAFAVRACPNLVVDPECSDGNDGNGKFIVKQTKPSVASFSGISGTRNDSENPSNVFLDFSPANTASGGIFDEYRVYVSDGTTSFDITDSNASNKLGAIYPSAPANYQDLYLDGFVKTNIASTYAKLNGLKPSIVYTVDVQAWVKRTAPLPISGGNIDIEYGSTGTISKNVSNTDTTPPQIISMTSTPTLGVIKEGEKLTLVVGFNEPITIAGSPRIAINVGGVIKYATFVGNTSRNLTFEYTAIAGDNDLDGIAFEGTNIALNGGAIADLSSNNAVLNFVAVAPDISVITVDTIPPAKPTNVIITKPWLSSVDKVQKAIWANPTEDFSHAEIGVGSAGNNIPNAVPFGATTASAAHTFADITGGLVECSQEYEVLVRSVDGAGLTSPPQASSTTFKFDKTPPSTPVITLAGQTNDVFNGPRVTWEISTDTCALHHYEIAIGKDAAGDGFDAGDVSNVMSWTEVPGGVGIVDYKPASGTDGMVFTLNATDKFRVSVRGVDAAGNPSLPSTTPDFIVDIAGPSEPQNLGIATNWITGALPIDSPQFTWQNPADADFQHSRVSLGSVIGQEDVSAPVNVGTLQAYTWAGLTGLLECQRYYPKVVAYDDIGNASVAAVSPPVWFAMDNTAPTLNGDIDISGGGHELAINKAPVTSLLSLVKADNCNALDRIEMAIGYDAAGDGFSGADITNTLNFTEIPGGPSVNQYQAQNGVDGMFFNLQAGRDYFISVRAVDKAGHISSIITASQKFSFVLDNTPPEVTITSSAPSPTTSQTFPIKITFSEPVIGFDVNKITLENGTASNFAGGPTVFTADVTATSFGRVKVNIRPGVATDEADNPNNAADELGVLYASADTFRTRWRVNAGDTITLPLRNHSSLKYDFYVDWGDGSALSEVTSFSDPDKSHTYTSAGVVTITCTGLMEGLYLGGSSSSMRNKLQAVISLGAMGWKNLHGAFYGAGELLTFAGGDVSQVTDMSHMFYGAQKLVSIDVANWDTGNVVNMGSLFYGLKVGNPDVSNWDVRKVTNMSQMFRGTDEATPNTSAWVTSSLQSPSYMFLNAKKANPDTSNWDMSKVTTLYMMFYRADEANPNTTNWDVSNVTNMYYAFGNTKKANPDTSNWNVSKVTTFSHMFAHAQLANPDTSNWVTSSATNMALMFYGALVANPNTRNWNTSNVRTMSHMFAYTKLANPDVSQWDVSQVTDMTCMFCYTEEAIPQTGSWTTSSLTTTNSMFSSAKKANPNVSGWDTSKVINMRHMFANNPALGDLDVANWDVSKVTNMEQMFYGSNVRVINSGNWNMSQVRNVTNMFAWTKFAQPQTSGWVLSEVRDCALMFYGSKKANPDVTNWNLGKARSFAHMFRQAEGIEDLNVANWDPKEVVDMQYMFQSSSLKNLNAANWNTPKLVNMYAMFDHARTAIPQMDNWDTSKVTNMGFLFRQANKANPNTANWNTGNVTNMRYMFQGASLAQPNTATWNVSKVTIMDHMFHSATAANPITTNWNTANVANMYSMFYGASAANPDVSNWNTGNVTSMGYMFAEAGNANPDVSTWNTSKVTNMSYMFASSSANPNISNWDISKVTSMRAMFYNNSYANPDMSGLNFSSVRDMYIIFWGTASSFTVENYGKFLNAVWNTRNTTYSGNIYIHVYGKMYPASAATARSNLNAANYTVIDGGQQAP